MNVVVVGFTTIYVESNTREHKMTVCVSQNQLKHTTVYHVMHKTLPGLTVHNQSTQVLSASSFGLLCKVANPAMLVLP